MAIFGGGIFVPTQASSVNFGGPSDLQPQTTEADLPILSQMLLADQRPTINLQHVHSCHSGGWSDVGGQGNHALLEEPSW